MIKENEEGNCSFTVNLHCKFLIKERIIAITDDFCDKGGKSLIFWYKRHLERGKYMNVTHIQPSVRTLQFCTFQYFMIITCFYLPVSHHGYCDRGFPTPIGIVIMQLHNLYYNQEGLEKKKELIKVDWILLNSLLGWSHC